MHELSMAEAVNNTIKELCERSGWIRVRRVVLKVGRMRQVDHGLLAFAFDIVARGTPSEGAELSVLELPTVFRCHSCGRKTATEGMAFVCMNCGSTNVELLSGMELTIESMEVDQQET
jgi:hydrogenase nickel incorporation protein HypA/HybF